jgi:hypothetical protein
VRDIRRRNDCDLVYARGLAGARIRAITAAVGGEIDDYSAWLHTVDLLFSDQFRGRAAGHGGCGNDEIGLPNMLGQGFVDDILLLGGKLARIAAFAAGIHAGLDELRAHRCCLLLGFRAHVVGFHYGTQPVGGCDRLQPGDAKAHHQFASLSASVGQAKIGITHKVGYKCLLSTSV